MNHQVTFVDKIYNAIRRHLKKKKLLKISKKKNNLFGKPNKQDRLILNSVIVNYFGPEYAKNLDNNMDSSLLLFYEFWGMVTRKNKMKKELFKDLDYIVGRLYYRNHGKPHRFFKPYEIISETVHIKFQVQNYTLHNVLYNDFFLLAPLRELIPLINKPDNDDILHEVNRILWRAVKIFEELVFEQRYEVIRAIYKRELIVESIVEHWLENLFPLFYSLYRFEDLHGAVVFFHYQPSQLLYLDPKLTFDDENEKIS